MDIVDGEESGDAKFFGFGRDEASHPVVAVDDVRLDAGDDMVDEVASEGEG